MTVEMQSLLLIAPVNPFICTEHFSMFRPSEPLLEMLVTNGPAVVQAVRATHTAARARTFFISIPVWLVFRHRLYNLHPIGSDCSSRSYARCGINFTLFVVQTRE